MMTLEEIMAAKVNPAVAREAYEQASKRLDDALATKAEYEQKAFALVGVLVLVSIAMFSAVGALLSLGEDVASLAAPFMAAGSVASVGGGMCLWALLDDLYGARGSHPEMWLKSGTIDGGEVVLPAMLAYIAHHHASRINHSVAANNAKAKKIRVGAMLGLASPIVLAIGLLWLW